MIAAAWHVSTIRSFTKTMVENHQNKKEWRGYSRFVMMAIGSHFRKLEMVQNPEFHI